MAESRGARASGLAAGNTGGSGSEPRINWEAAERSPEFRELIRERRRFVVPATLFFLAWYFGFILLAGYAPDFMGRSVYEGLTVGYCLAFTQFLMTWGLAAAYLRRADSTFDPLAKKAAQRAVDVGVTSEGGAR
jgi:uncharacterized membrane protein (DUF485 family)